LIQDKINELLGNDLLKLVNSVGAGLLEVEPLSRSYVPGLKKGCFLLRFSNNRILKGRRFLNSKRAKRVHELSKFLDSNHFPEVLSHNRTALLLNWIDGKPLSSSKCTLETLRECGELHSMIHNIKLPDEIIESALKEINISYKPRFLKVRKKIRELVLLGLLHKAEAGKLFEVITEHAPKSFDFGLIPGDFFSENLIIAPSGHINFIDTESLAVDAYDYDLGRTWYRWTMNSDEREVYISGYISHRSIESFRKHFYYWMIIVLVSSALFRFKFGTKETSHPIKKLGDLIKAVKDKNTSNPELFF